jgi:hypothetical protein
MNKFSDFADLSVSPVMDGKKTPLNDILGKEIIVHRYRVKNTKYSDAKNPECLTVQFTFPEAPEELKIFFSGSSVLTRQLEQYKEKIPFSSVIKRVGKYFTFS